MKCPQCEAEGIKSTIDDRHGWTTSMGVARFHDEDGRYHVHDRNRTTTDLRCSKNHDLRLVSRKGCKVEGCDFGTGETWLYVMEKVEQPRSSVQIVLSKEDQARVDAGQGLSINNASFEELQLNWGLALT